MLRRRDYECWALNGHHYQEFSLLPTPRLREHEEEETARMYDWEGGRRSTVECCRLDTVHLSNSWAHSSSCCQHKICMKILAYMGEHLLRPHSTEELLAVNSCWRRENNSSLRAWTLVGCYAPLDGLLLCTYGQH